MSVVSLLRAEVFPNTSNACSFTRASPLFQLPIIPFLVIRAVLLLRSFRYRSNLRSAAGFPFQVKEAPDSIAFLTSVSFRAA